MTLLFVQNGMCCFSINTSSALVHFLCYPMFGDASVNLPPIFCTRLFNSGLAREQQRVPAFAAQVAAAFVDQPVALGAEREVAVRAGAAIDVTGHAAAFDVIRMATIGRQFVHPAHD